MSHKLLHAKDFVLRKLHKSQAGGGAGDRVRSGPAFRLVLPLLLIGCTVLMISGLHAQSFIEAEISAVPLSPSSTPAPELTPEENAWLKEHQVIRYGADPDWPPFTSENGKGELEGIDALLFNELSGKLKTRFIYVPAASWTEALANFREGKIDMLLATAKTAEREHEFLFTKPYYEFPVALVSRTESPFLTTQDQLLSLRVAGPRDHVTTNALRSTYPGIHIIECETSAECLQMVARGDADVTIGNLAAMGYQIGTLDLSQLKVSGLLDERFGLRYAVRRDWPELVGILDKSLEVIPQTRKNEFVSAVIAPELQRLAQRSSRRRQSEWAALVGIAVASMLGCLAITLFYQVRYRKQREGELNARKDELESTVASRTAELTHANMRLQAEAAERAKTTEILRLSEEKFSMLFQSLPDGALVSTLADGIILDVNPAFCECTGYAVHELIGQSTMSLNLWADPARRSEVMESIANSDHTVNWEADFRRRDGEIIPVQFSSRLVEYAGQRCMIGVARELTEIRKAEALRQRLEDQLRQAQKMEALGRLTGGVAHDFNNLLQVIQGNVLMLKEADDPAERELFLDGLMEASERAAGLTRQLLSFSRGQPLRKERIELDPLLRSEVRLLQGVMPDSIDLVYECHGAGTWIEGDRTQLSQVIMNLCVNARDAMPAGGMLRIDLDTVPASEVMDVHEMPKAAVLARIRVSDTGIGMDEATKARIFEPFFSTKSSDRGTGLGLAVVYGVVEKHGGHIQVTSQRGAGTTFTLHFPSSHVKPALAGAVG